MTGVCQQSCLYLLSDRVVPWSDIDAVYLQVFSMRVLLKTLLKIAKPNIAFLMSIFNKKKKMAKALLSSLDNMQDSNINLGEKKT